MRDPRVARITHELSARRVVLVTGAKGGVGKTVVSALLGIALSDKGRKVLLVDADATDPNLHVVLGVDPEKDKPGEAKGIEPLALTERLGYVGLAPYTMNRPTPLRGPEAVDAVREILGVLDYNGYEYVVIDTPPGLDDVLMDLIHMIGDKAFVIVVSTPSRMSEDSTRRYMALLRSLGLKNIVNVINDVTGIGVWSRKDGFLVPHDESLEKALGSIEKLKATSAYKAIARVAGAVNP
jgi:Mrp family chromosome partitioning ATPase